MTQAGADKMVRPFVEQSVNGHYHLWAVAEPAASALVGVRLYPRASTRTSKAWLSSSRLRAGQQSRRGVIPRGGAREGSRPPHEGCGIGSTIGTVASGREP